MVSTPSPPILTELEQLSEAGLIKGGDLDNAIVLVDREMEPEEMQKLSKLFNRPAIQAKEGILNNVELRHRNEPARHKLLDLIGDLALIGARHNDGICEAHFVMDEANGIQIRIVRTE